MSVNLVAAEKDCFVDLNTVAIGGGGGTSKYAGSGSGYVETATLRLSVNNPVAEITVGQVDESSKVEIAGELVLEALPGLPGQTVKGYTGGAGFSGGGGSCYQCTGGLGGSGGSDGGNGTNKPAPFPGGKGSAFDLSLVHMKNFILTPGAGGQPRTPSRSVGPSRGYGGGGGGVAVNGKMPDVTSKYAGAGFGGGSADEYSSSGYPGYQGCVIVEI